MQQPSSSNQTNKPVNLAELILDSADILNALFLLSGQRHPLALRVRRPIFSARALAHPSFYFAMCSTEASPSKKGKGKKKEEQKETPLVEKLVEVMSISKEGAQQLNSWLAAPLEKALDGHRSTYSKMTAIMQAGQDCGLVVAGRPHDELTVWPRETGGLQFLVSNERFLSDISLLQRAGCFNAEVARELLPAIELSTLKKAVPEKMAVKRDGLRI